MRGHTFTNEDWEAAAVCAAAGWARPIAQAASEIAGHFGSLPPIVSDADWMELIRHLEGSASAQALPASAPPPVVPQRLRPLHRALVSPRRWAMRRFYRGLR